LFKIDTLVETVVSVYFMVSEKRDPLTEVTLDLALVGTHFKKPKHLKYHPGKNIQVKENSYVLPIGLESK